MEQLKEELRHDQSFGLQRQSGTRHRAASGMGLATAQAFAGASVVLADVNEDAVRGGAEKLVAAGHKALAVGCDVSDDAQVAAMVDRTVVEFGRLDAAFNNAGIMARIAPTAESTREDWDRVIGINLRGVWSCMKHELRQMEIADYCASNKLYPQIQVIKAEQINDIRSR